MSKSIDEGKAEAARIRDYFQTNRAGFTSPGVKEAHIRQTLIDPLFEALGWDMANRAMLAPQYREVITEDSFDVEGHHRAPDYTFRVGTLPKFFVEAKKCDINIHTSPLPAYQLRRYGWSAKVAVSILTNFEVLAVYDCTIRPKESDKASRSRILFFRFDEYVDRWAELWDVFSREAVWSGKFDQFAVAKRKRGDSEVDVEFLKEIEAWRETLARNLALRNSDLSADDLNAAVQRTIDRVVFLRMAEARGLESDEQLLKLCERPNIYPRFMRDLCRKADEKYNSGLFHFHKEDDVTEPPDRVTPKLTVDDKVFKPILQSLYFQHGSPYHFGVLPVEILGAVYERFLGKVIRLTTGHQAKIEEKPAVRKAGGVYYTPAHIVTYIIQQTVGKQMEGQTPAQLAGGKMQPAFRVLDMACGSGSFLLGAYQYLLDYFLKWYIDHKPETHKRAVYRGPKEEWRLSIGEKKRILTTHIYGVDIDAQAVEVSKLSLLLKALEGESDVSLSMQMKLFEKSRALPNLSANIKCGNSLIGPDYFTGRLIRDSDEMKRVNPFDWNREFPDALKSGGFDCVIGNPPYIRIQTMKEWAPLEVNIYKELFRASRTGNYDIYVVFIERGLALVKDGGRLGYIVPNKFFRTDYGVGLRALLAESRTVEQIVDFGHHQVFAASIYTCLLFLAKDNADSFKFAAGHSNAESLRALCHSTRGKDTLTPDAWTLENAESAALLKKLTRRTRRLLDLPAAISRGSSTGSDDLFIFERGALTVEEDIVRTPLFAGDFGRYHFSIASKSLVIFPYVREADKYRLFTETELKQRFPLAHRHLKKHEQALRNRKQYTEWYGYSAPRNLALHDAVDIAIPLLADAGVFAMVPETVRGRLCPMASGGFTISLSDQCPLKREYVLGLLNSKLLFWRLRAMSNVFRGGWITCTKQYVAELPIRDIELTNSNEREQQDAVASLVQAMQTLRSQLNAATGASATVIQRQIDATDAEIDRLVYNLYGLTDEEIAIVEGEKP